MSWIRPDIVNSNIEALKILNKYFKNKEIADKRNKNLKKESNKVIINKKEKKYNNDNNKNSDKTKKRYKKINKKILNTENISEQLFTERMNKKPYLEISNI